MDAVNLQVVEAVAMGWLTELLREIAALTGFSSMFRELRSDKVHDNPSCILAAVLADAPNLDLKRMANASQGISYAPLALTQSWYLSEENYKAALARIIEVHHAQPFARHWGDGQSLVVRRTILPVRATAGRSGAGAVNAKYGPEPGLLHPPLGHARLVPHPRAVGHFVGGALCARRSATVPPAANSWPP